ncbi:hypothetical protein GCM10009077_21480 [Roseibium denhamense]
MALAQKHRHDPVHAEGRQEENTQHEHLQQNVFGPVKNLDKQNDQRAGDESAKGLEQSNKAYDVNKTGTKGKKNRGIQTFMVQKGAQAPM